MLHHCWLRTLQSAQRQRLFLPSLILAIKFLLQTKVALLAAEEQLEAELPGRLSDGSSHGADVAATTVAAEASSSSEEELRGVSLLQLFTYAT